MPEWTFITKHALVLSIIAKNPKVTGLELARELGITERAARKLIAELYENGYISKKKEGRRIRYSINQDQPLRRVTHRDVTIGNLLDTLGWKRGKSRSKNV